MESALTIKGQATIPKAVRDHLRLRPGDRIKFFKHPDGTVVLLPKVPTSTLKGMLASPRKHSVPLREMEDAIAGGAAANTARRRR